MKYARQTQEARERLDQSLHRLRDIIKRGQIQEAIQFMEEGDLKERFSELQNIITISSTGTLGARGTQQVANI